MQTETRWGMACRLGLVFAFWAVIGAAWQVDALAQSTTEGAIGGTVTDQTKAVVPGATVDGEERRHQRARPRPSPTRAATSPSSGCTPAPTRSRSASADSRPFNQSGVIVEVGRVTNLDVTLSVGGQTETVSVVAQAPVINRESTDLSTNINQTSLAEPAGQRAALVQLRAEHAGRGAGRHVRPDQLPRHLRAAQQQHRGRRRQHAGVLRRRARPHAPQLLAEPRPPCRNSRSRRRTTPPSTGGPPAASSTPSPRAAGTRSTARGSTSSATTSGARRTPSRRRSRSVNGVYQHGAASSPTIGGTSTA